MNSNIIESIKSDNLDLFKLLFDINKIDIKKLSKDDFEQLYDELLQAIHYINYPKHKKHIKLCEEFKYMVNPKEFLELCDKYNSKYILNDYNIQIHQLGQKFMANGYLLYCM